MPTDRRYDEAMLLDALREGRADAFEEIFNRHWEKLYRQARFKLQSHEEAEEVLQNIFSSLWERRETLLITNLTFYLNTALRNRVLNVIRNRLPEKKSWEYYKTFIPNNQETTDQDVAFEELNNAVEVAVGYLPEKSRRVFQLSRMEGLSNSEIANLLNVSEKAIEYHLTKSIRLLRVHLKDYITIWAILMLADHF